MSSMLTTVKKANPLRRSPDAVAVGLAWFGIALGLAKLLRPRAVEQRTGVRPGATMTRLMGLRGIGTGIGLLGATDRTPWLAARAAGDAIDMAALLGRRRPGALGGTALALFAVAGVLVLDAAAAAAVKSRAQHDAAGAWDYSDRVGLRRP